MYQKISGLGFCCPCPEHTPGATSRPEPGSGPDPAKKNSFFKTKVSRTLNKKVPGRRSRKSRIREATSVALRAFDD